MGLWLCYDHKDDSSDYLGQGEDSPSQDSSWDDGPDDCPVTQADWKEKSQASSSKELHCTGPIQGGWGEEEEWAKEKLAYSEQGVDDGLIF